MEGRQIIQPAAPWGRCNTRPAASNIKEIASYLDRVAIVDLSRGLRHGDSAKLHARMHFA